MQMHQEYQDYCKAHEVPKAIFWAGYDAQRSGLSYDSNPYDCYSGKGQVWCFGFEEAEQDTGDDGL